MAILVLGANGFIGRHVADALEAAGFAVRRGARPAHDLSRLYSAADAAAWLEDCDAVVNAVGIFREAGSQTFDAVHTRGPMKLFDACAAAGIPVVQLSALGANGNAATAFLRSKAAADAHLLSLPVPSLVLQPSLVFGPDGASARAFATLATLPLLPLPGRGEQRVQPVHVDDVAAAVTQTLRRQAYSKTRIAAVGPAPLALREYLLALRRGMHAGPAWLMPVPMPLVRLAARWRMGLLDRAALRMLEQGSVADPAPFEHLLGRAPRAPDRLIPPRDAPRVRREARLGWLLPLLRASLAFMWLAAAVVSAGIYPLDESRAMLARLGLTGPWALLALYGAAAMDAALGVATFVVRRRALWTLQLLLVLAYTAIITAFLPEQWLHPFGPVVKNIPVLAAILLMREMEAR